MAGLLLRQGCGVYPGGCLELQLHAEQVVLVDLVPQLRNHPHPDRVASAGGYEQRLLHPGRGQCVQHGVCGGCEGMLARPVDHSPCTKHGLPSNMMALITSGCVVGMLIAGGDQTCSSSWDSRRWSSPPAAPFVASTCA